MLTMLLTLVLWALAIVGAYVIYFRARLYLEQRESARVEAGRPKPTVDAQRALAGRAAYRAVRDAVDVGATDDALAEFGIWVDRAALAAAGLRIQAEREARYAEFDEWVKTPERIAAARAELSAQLLAAQVARLATEPPPRQRRFLRLR